MIESFGLQVLIQVHHQSGTSRRLSFKAPGSPPAESRVVGGPALVFDQQLCHELWSCHANRRGLIAPVLDLLRSVYRCSRLHRNFRSPSVSPSL